MVGMINNEDNREVGKNDFSDSVKIYYKELKYYKPISKEEERRLLKLAKEGDVDARNRIVNANLRFVFNIAKKYRNNGVDIADLISAGKNHTGFSSCFFFVDFAEKQYQFFQLRVLNI